MAKFFYCFKTGQIILSILCIIFLSAVNELCRTEQVNVKETRDVRNASAAVAASTFPESNAPSSSTILGSLIDAKSDNGTELTEILKIFSEVSNDSKIMNDSLMQMNEELDGKMDEADSTLMSTGTKNHVGNITATALNATPLNTTLDATMDAGIDTGNDTKLLQSLNETFNDLRSDVLSPMNTNVDDDRTKYKPSVNQVNIDPTLLLLPFPKNRTLSQSSQFFINDSRMLQYTTYCISLPFFEGGIYDFLNGKNVSTSTGTYSVYADKLSSRFIPIISLSAFIIYCILRMICLLAAPYSANTDRHRCCCHCSDIVHNCFSMLILGGGLLKLLYAHHNWSNIRDWPHIDAIVDFPAFWDFAEVLLLILILSVAIEIGLGDSVYGIIKLDQSDNGYHLPLHQADSTLMSTTSIHSSSIHPVQLRNYFDDAQQEANERELTITEIANLHRCYGSRRSGSSAPLPKSPAFNSQHKQQFPSPSVATHKSSSSTNTYLNCACSTFKPSSNYAI